MRLEKCWFCSSTIYPGHGIQFVRNDAKIFKFCRSKCHKNFKLKRNPRKVKWTKVYRTPHGKDVPQDSAWKLERKQNRPKRYDRNLTEDILDGIRRCDRSKNGEANRHILERLKANKHRREKEKQRALHQGLSLINAPPPPTEPFSP
uniref:TRASH domain-containing protein n=1 Tax=Opuntia streptacantha TaxID=393608 RepID=A0A7C8ZDG3_OPUST